jgi:hypothetical protein
MDKKKLKKNCAGVSLAQVVSAQMLGSPSQRREPCAPVCGTAELSPPSAHHLYSSPPPKVSTRSSPSNASAYWREIKVNRPDSRILFFVWPRNEDLALIPDVSGRITMTLCGSCQNFSLYSFFAGPDVSRGYRLGAVQDTVRNTGCSFCSLLLQHVELPTADDNQGKWLHLFLFENSTLQRSRLSANAGLRVNRLVVMVGPRYFDLPLDHPKNENTYGLCVAADPSLLPLCYYEQ